MTIPGLMNSHSEQCKICGIEPIEWADAYCQMCWESFCAVAWWEMIKRLENSKAV